MCLDFLFQCHIPRKSIFKTLTMLFIFYFFISKNASQETMLRDLQEKINSQEISLTSEKLKLALSDLEKQRDGSQALFKEREHRVEQVSEKLSKTERESEAY